MQEPKQEPIPPAGWRSAVSGNVLMMGLVSLFTDFSSEMINPILPVFFAALAGGHEAAFWVGLSEGVSETTAAVLKIFSGRISDRLGKRKALVVLGYGLSSVCRPAIALVGAGTAGALQTIGLKFGDRVGKGLRTSPRDALIGDSVDPAHRGLAFSFHRLMDHTGAILGPLAVIAVLYLFLGYARWGAADTNGAVSDRELRAIRVVFGLALLPGLAAMAALIFKVREIAPPPAPAEPSIARPSVWKRLPRRFYGFVGIVTLFALGNSSDMFLLLLGWRMFDMGLVQIVLLWIALHAMKIAMSIPGGVLSDRLGRRPVIVAGWSLYTLVYCGLAWLGDAHGRQADVAQPWVFWLLIMVYGLYYGLTEGVEKALVADTVPSEHRGTAFGIYHGALGIAALPASLLFGVFWLAVGPVWAFGIGAGLAGSASLLMMVFLSTERSASRRRRYPSR